MQFEITTEKLNSLQADLAIAPVYQDGAPAKATAGLSAGLRRQIGDALASGDVRGKPGDTLLLTHTGRLGVRHLLLAGLGAKDKLDAAGWRKAMEAAVRRSERSKAGSIVNLMGLEEVSGMDTASKARAFAEQWLYATYRYTATRKAPKDTRPRERQLTVAVGGDTEVGPAKAGLRQGRAIGRARNYARELGNLPANICTPAYLASEARKLARRSTRVTAKILLEKEMKELGMNSLLSVCEGSELTPRLIVLHYKGAADDTPPVALVGKGVTFDTGGISLKPGRAMDEMKFDMSGAGSVLGTLHATIELKLPINLLVVAAAVENMPSGRATKPGDIVKAMSGETIEVLNTDAEGRLILADALYYSLRFKPSKIVDVATLTGACLMALGRHYSGLFANNDGLAEELRKAGDKSSDPVWRLPMGPEYMPELKSNFADMANIGSRFAGATTAACFLSRFVKDAHWAHLDIAGTAWKTGGGKGSTGRPVPLLTEFLLGQ
ncbi:MAG: leucyl aminopeptidase [Gammaproteobacteria bacterium]|nr:leucyl aminopeptidase [Gammaproteobacteria bacterium]